MSSVDCDQLRELSGARAQVTAPEQFREIRRGKFGHGRDAAVEDVVTLRAFDGGDVENRAVERAAQIATPKLREGCLHACDRVGDGFGLFVVEAHDFGEHALEGGLTGAILAREISAGDEGFAAGREEHGERPAACVTESGRGRLVDLIDVGAFFTVDLDVDELLVHERGDFRIAEALLVHDMAPVARRVADREQDGFAGRLRLFEGRLSPGTPVNGIVLVQKKIRARLLLEQIAAHVSPGDGALRRGVAKIGPLAIASLARKL